MATPGLIPNPAVKRGRGDDTHIVGKVANRRNKVYNFLKNKRASLSDALLFCLAKIDGNYVADTYVFLCRFALC